MIEFKINGIDISNDVILNSVTYMTRLDEVFGTGSLDFESKEFTENIPPYSILKMDGVYYCCSSESSYHFGSGSWFHKVSIIEATSLLSRFLIGSKAFSITGTNKFDYEKINILLNLVNQKYGVNVEITGDLSAVFNQQIEYVFTAGTTLFDALSEIAKQYNVKFYVDLVDGDRISVSFTQFSKLGNLAFDEKDIISLTRIQNAETYCNYLESEATNVIDTNLPVTLKNVFAKSNDIKLNEDTFHLELPTPAYKVNSVTANMLAEMEVLIQIDDPNSSYLEDNYPEGTYKTYREWETHIPALKTIYNDVFSKYGYLNFNFYDVEWIVESYNAIWSIRPIDNSVLRLITYPKKLNVLSEEQYQLLLDQDKPDYIYYKTGSNIIDGLNIFYKNDFWNTILGNLNKPALLDPINDYTYLDYTLTFGGDTFETQYWISLKKFNIRNGFDDTKIINTLYDIEYYPMGNPYIVSKKKDIPSNETKYKPYSISYNKSGNYVDFDKLHNSINIENNSMGRIEMVVEYDITDYKFMLNYYRKLDIRGYTWYIESSNTKYQGQRQITTFHLVKEYNKKADVISLNSQYNTVKNPLENIMERPIFYETNEAFEYKQGSSYLLFDFKKANGNSINRVILPAVVFTNGDDTYLYCEMQDQYSAGRKAVYVNGNNYKLNDVAYVDENNEAYSVSIAFVIINGKLYNSGPEMPQFNDSMVIQNSYNIGDLILYKDAREKLTFTIKAKNCIIK